MAAKKSSKKKDDNWIQDAVDPKKKGVFSAKAKRAGMSTAAYAKKVTAPGSKASKETKDQARFALNVGKLRKKSAKKKSSRKSK